VAGVQKCQIENRTAAEEKLAGERRRRAAEDAKSNRKKVTDEALAQEAEDTAALDNLLEKLRNGDNVGRRARRARPSAVSTKEPAAALPPSDKKEPPPISDIAQSMLEQLKTNGFVSESFAPVSPTTVSAPRRRRLRVGTMAAALAAELEAAGAGGMLDSPGSTPGTDRRTLLAGLGTFQDDGSDTGRED
jgi:cytokinesis protein